MWRVTVFLFLYFNSMSKFLKLFSLMEHIIFYIKNIKVSAEVMAFFMGRELCMADLRTRRSCEISKAKHLWKHAGGVREFSPDKDSFKSRNTGSAVRRFVACWSPGALCTWFAGHCYGHRLRRRGTIITRRVAPSSSSSS